MGTEDIFPDRILKFGQVEKNFNFSTRDPGHLHACAIFSKNRCFGTTHRDKPCLVLTCDQVFFFSRERKSVAVRESAVGRRENHSRAATLSCFPEKKNT